MTLGALERTLRERPDDLASWLVYGDRLRERGDPRAELIRLAERRARVGPGEGRRAVEREIDALVAEHREKWDAELPEGVSAPERRHGFATAIAVEWDDGTPMLIEQALRAEPLVTALRIAPPEQDPYEYDHWDDDTDDDGEPLPSADVEAGALATLDLAPFTSVDLSYLRVGALGAKALAVSSYFRSEAAGGQALATPAAGRIGSLDLRYCHIGDSGLAALAANPFFTGVRRLHLQRNALTARGVRALHAFADLTELDLRYNEIGEEGAEALLAAPFLGSLTRLLLYAADVGDAGARRLASAPELPPVLRSYWRSV
ncbi:TIGR02996 domain-containing protein [Streptomyces sp. WMMC500]|uniref:TIGR02996 domain-containing protein n=1 Tax=Streptomyces sp. WMMC500 TaxID=3015154 RepID=UPI00248BF671|nr:TIGR02996 domain-containing protein [Streptomyces sp. WMMC500]WBB61690.1 TIGR02996 domain-containing protein [Streptomyces sp. WMMC500]